MMIPGYHDNGAFQTTEWVSMLLVSLVPGAALFWFVVPGGGAVTAVVLGTVAVVSLLVFWAGLTLPIAAAGAVVGWRGRESAEQRGLATSGLALSALAAVALVAIIVGDGLSN